MTQATQQITITEALSELNLIKKKIEKKEEAILGSSLPNGRPILGMLVRYQHTPDVFANQNGSVKYLKAELQSIEDLRLRAINIRAAISKANTGIMVDIFGKTQSVNEWLTWKRDHASAELAFHTKIASRVKGALDNQATQPQLYKDEKGENNFVVLLANTDYADHLKKAEDIQQTLDALDGKLSLNNAITLITV